MVTHDPDLRKANQGHALGQPPLLNDPGALPPLGSIGRFAGPAGASLACHALLIGLLAFAAWASVETTNRDPIFVEFQAKVVTEATPAGTGGGFRFHFPGRAHLDRPDSAQAHHQAETIQELASLLKSEASFQPAPIEPSGAGLANIAFDELRRSDVVGIGNGGGTHEGGLGSGLGNRDLPGGGPVGSMWGVGKGQVARSVVYVMDRSGSMAESFARLQRELLRAIGSLDAEQLFNVLWFNEGPAQQLSDRMLAATIENKREAFAAIKGVVPSGQTEPLDAVKKGLSYRPDVLFLLSDGDFGQDNDRILGTINQMNKHKVTTINTILFVYDTGGEGEKILRAIAEANNGVFKHVTEQDLQR